MSSLSQPKYVIDIPEFNINENDNVKTINIDTLSNTNSNNSMKTQEAICNLIDVINDNNLNIFYQDSPSNFKHNIDQLNLKFYLETEKILNSNGDITSNQDKLFLILFKQINLYIKEIERLNTVILEQGKDPLCLKKRMTIITKQRDDFEIKENLIQTLKISKNTLEKKVSDLLVSENNVKIENEKLKKENKYLKDILNEKNYISVDNIQNKIKDVVFEEFKEKNKRTYSDPNNNLLNNDIKNYNLNNINNNNEFESNNIISNNLLNSNNNLNNLKNETIKFEKSPNKKSNSKLKIIKSIKNKMNNTNFQNTTTTNFNKNELKSPRNNKEFNFSKSLNNSNNNTYEELELHDLIQIENLLLDMKKYFLEKNKNGGNL
jgi:hypothetical protein